MLFDLFRLPARDPSGELGLTPKRPTATIVLGGGGARGLAHLGAMEVLGESAVQTERIVGVSIGSLVGALCAADSNPARVQAKVLELLHSPIFRHKHRQFFGDAYSDSEGVGGLFSWYSRIKRVMSAHRRLRRAVTGPSLMMNTLLREVIEELVPDVDLADLETKLSVVAVDLLSGHRIVLEAGPLRQAILASSAVPGIFPPVRWGDMLLCDSGVVDSLPCDLAAAYGNEWLVAVDVGQEASVIHSCNSALDVMMRMDDIAERLLRRRSIPDADLVIRPRVGGVSWCDFNDPESLMEAGRTAARRAMHPFHLLAAA